MYNILEHKTEAERIVFEDSDKETGFILLPDMKWTGTDTSELYLVAIVHKHGIRSLRDLSTEHLPLLRNILHAGKVSVMHILFKLLFKLLGQCDNGLSCKYM